MNNFKILEKKISVFNIGEVIGLLVLGLISLVVNDR